MNVQRAREQIAAAAAVIGFIIAGIVFWKLVAAFLWICHYAGFAM